MNEPKTKTLGVLGGLGPMASAYFYEMLTEHTAAERDCDHIDMVISSRASTYDRTDFITGRSTDNPLDMMIPDARRLETYGADMLVLPCNTAHYFYDSLAASVNIPVISIIDVTVRHCVAAGRKKAGILATEGTLVTDTYQRGCRAAGLDYAVPDAADMAALMDIIYGSIKKGRTADMRVFLPIAGRLFGVGCDCIILGCTELSLIKRECHLPPAYVDSLEVLAYESIIACGKTPIGFDFQDGHL